MPRTLLRTLSTAATTLSLLLLTALPALASSSTKPAKDEEFLIGSMEQLPMALGVGVVLAIIAWILLPSRDATATDEHH